MDFPGSIVVKTLHFQCRGHRFDPRSGNQDPACHMVQPKPFLNDLKKKKRRKKRKLLNAVLKTDYTMSLGRSRKTSVEAVIPVRDDTGQDLSGCALDIFKEETTGFFF